MRIAAFLIIPFLSRFKQDSRTPIPSDNDQAQAERTIRDIFRDDISKRDLVQRREMAKRLLKLGVEARNEPASRYVLYCEAADLAARAGDPRTAYAAVDELTKAFQVDPDTAKYSILLKAKSYVSKRDGYQALADCFFRLVDDELIAARYDRAREAGEASVVAATLAQDGPLATLLERKVKSVAEGKESFERAQKAEGALATHPDDPLANLALGSHLCGTMGRWEKGLPFLTKGSDRVLSALSTRDLASPTAWQEQSEVGDAWLEWAKSERDPWKKASISERARHWYKLALPSAAPSAKLLLETRLSEIEKTLFLLDPVTTRLPTEGLVAWWKLDEGEGDEVKDSSPAQNHGRLFGPKWDTGKFKAALRFNGTDNFVQISPRPYTRVTTNFTMALWALPTPPDKPSSKGGYAIFPSHGEMSYGSPDHVGAGIWVSTKGVGVVEHTSSYIQARANYGRELTAWTHIAVVYLNSQPKIYINGRLSKTGLASERIVHPGCCFGEMNEKAVYGAYAGLLEDVRIYDRVLSDSEIWALALQ